MAGSRLRFKLHPVSGVVVLVAVVVFAFVGLLRLGVIGSGGADEQATASQPQSVSNVDPPGYGFEEGTQTGQGSADSGGVGGTGGSAPEETEGPVVVHVTGAVKDPGVVQLPATSRVADAVEAAGGLSTDADMASVNLAEFAVDGTHIHVALKGESPSPVAHAGAANDSGAGGCVEVNTADATALQQLDGVGPKLAERILNHRETNGPFANGDALVDVPGIGAVLVERIKVGLCQ